MIFHDIVFDIIKVAKLAINSNYITNELLFFQDIFLIFNFLFNYLIIYDRKISDFIIVTIKHSF